jgi:hypothetical protein
MQRSEAERRAAWSSYLRILQALAASGKNVVLVLQAPELPDVMESLIYDPTAPATALPGLSRHWWGARNAYVRERLHEIPAGVVVVDPADSFCDATVCYAARGNVSYYFDDDHMSVAGAAVIAGEILRSLGFPQAPGA